MDTYTQIQNRTRGICDELIALMMEVASSPQVQSTTLQEMLITYGHAERVLANIEESRGHGPYPREQASKHRLMANGLAVALQTDDTPTAMRNGAV